MAGEDCATPPGDSSPGRHPQAIHPQDATAWRSHRPPSFRSHRRPPSRPQTAPQPICPAPSPKTLKTAIYRRPESGRTGLWLAAGPMNAPHDVPSETALSRPVPSNKPLPTPPPPYPKSRSRFVHNSGSRPTSDYLAHRPRYASPGNPGSVCPWKPCFTNLCGNNRPGTAYPSLDQNDQRAFGKGLADIVVAPGLNEFLTVP